MKSPGSLLAFARASAAPFPYQSIPDTTIAILEGALRLAWQEACAFQAADGIDYLSCSENQITDHLVQVMGTLCNGTPNLPMGAFGEFFDMPEVDGSFPARMTASTRSGSTKPTSPPRKRPDYAFRLKGAPRGYDPRWYALFVEAKPLDSKHPVSEYGSAGLRRFTSGEYAWSMRQGVMLGYVRDASLELPHALDRFLDQRRNEYGVSKMPEAVTFSRKRMRMHETTHERTTKNLQTGDPLGPIRVFHLWLSVEAAPGRPVQGRTLPAAA